MINLLPPEKKQELILKNRRKVVIILGIVIIVPIICFALILISINLYALAEIEEQKQILNQAKLEYETADFLNFKDIIQENNKNLIFLQSFYKKEFYMSDALKELLTVDRSEKLHLKDLNLTRQDNQVIKFTATGFSPTREELIFFKDNLERQPLIKNVYFSADSWVNPQNVRFYVNFEISKK